MAGTNMPQVTVEIRGADKTGKSIVGQVLRRALRHEEVTVVAGARAALRPWEELKQALRDLRGRGLLVEIVETETAGPIQPKRQVDASLGARPLVTGLRGWAPGLGAPAPGLPADERAALLALGFEPVDQGGGQPARAEARR